MWFVCAGLEPAQTFTGNVQLPLSLLGHSCPSPKSGLIPDDFHYCPYHLLFCAGGMPASYITSQSLM
jgi:hypothetical protein